MAAPFTLLKGDAHANIDAFKSQPVPSPPWTTEWKIHTLLNMGFPTHVIHEGLRAMARASWSANITEQGHVALAMVAKTHPQMKAVTMQDKAFGISAKPLVQPNPNAHEVAIEQLQHALAKLDSKMPSRCHGKHIVVRQLIKHGQHAIKGKASEKWKQRTLTHVRKTVFTKHASTWKNMLESQKSSFRAEAQAHQASQIQAHLEQRRDIWSRIAQHRAAIQSPSHDEGNSIKMSDATFSHADLLGLESIWNDMDCNHFTVPEQAYEVRSMLVPLQHIIEQAPSPPTAHFKPFWAGMLCRGRDHVMNAIIKIITDNNETFYFKFMFANAQKHVVGMVKLMPLNGHGDIDFNFMTTSEQAKLEAMDIGFRIVSNDFTYSDDAMFRRTHSFDAIIDSKTFPGAIVAAMEQWQSSDALEPILGGMVKEQHAREQTMKARLPLAMDAQYIQELMVDYPWMVQYIDAKDFWHGHRNKTQYVTWPCSRW